MKVNEDKFTIAYEIELESNLIGVDECEYKKWWFHLRKALPNFVHCYRDELTICSDTSLDNGIEIKPKTYFLGIKTAFDFLETFFEDFETQDTFFFDVVTTGFHINISLDVPETEKNFNFLKAILLLREVTPILKSLSYRAESLYCKSIEQEFYSLIASANFLDLSSIKTLEASLLKLISYNLLSKDKYKKLDLNLLKSKLGYLEFRFPGGLVSLEDLKELTLAYSSLVQASLDTSFLANSYMEKLEALRSNLLQTLTPSGVSLCI